MANKTVIIGGVAGGATTAARLRRRDDSREIVMVERGEYISYANCGLPYYIGDVIKSRDALLLMTPEEMLKKFNIDVRIASEVTSISPDRKVITIKNLKTGEEYDESYDSLVLATGSSPIRPSIKGIEAENIFSLWTVPDMDAIRSYVNQHQPKRASVIGGGFIGLEMAENLHGLGVEVTVIEREQQVMAPLDIDMANLIHENMQMNGVQLVLNDGVSSFEKMDGVQETTIHLMSGKQVKADLIILSLGIRPNSELAVKAGIEVNNKGGVIVNEYLETSVRDIYAVGDVIEVNHIVSGNKTMIPLAGPANKQGRLLADNLAGDHKPYDGSMGTAVAKVMDFDVASVGLNEKQLMAQGKSKNKDYYTALINQRSHAGYYPGATLLTLKLIFDKQGSILGCQIVGQDGVDKRIDTVATTMRLKGSIYDLAKLELAYAPPFSSAKDPVNMLGFVAENILAGLVSFIEWDEMDELTKDDVTILDVTEDVERMVSAIEGSYHIPLGQLHSRLDELDREKLIIPYCAIGVRSYTAARILMQNGFNHVKVLSGGISFYKSMHAQIEPVTMQTEHDSQDLVRAAEERVELLDCCGLQCPGPIMKVNQAISNIEDNTVLKVSATDMGFAKDIDSWCRRTGNTLVKTERKDKENIVYIRKGNKTCMMAQDTSVSQTNEGKTIIVFSGDLDKVLASFIIANGAAAMGRPVTMFFTFWGLNVLRKHNKTKLKKPFMDKMFGRMMPRGSKRLKLSKLNMGGMGTAMMKKVMKDKNVDSLEALMKHAQDNGIKLVACTMSMDIMGITKEELIDGVELAGVASYLGDAEESNVNLFI